MDERLLHVLEQARGGDKKAYEILVEEFTPKLKAIGRHYLHSSFDVEDTLQEVWIKVYKNLDALREPLKFPSWLAQIMRFHALKKLKDEKKGFERGMSITSDLAHELTEYITDDRDSISEVIERKELKQIVDKILKAMPEIYSLPLRLYYIDNLKVSEIEQLLDLTNSTVKWRLHQGRAIFKKNIGKKLYGYHN